MEALIAIVLLIGIVAAAIHSQPDRHRPPKRDPVSSNPRKVAEAASEPVTPAIKERKIPSTQLKVDHAPPPPIPSSMEIIGRAHVIDGDTIAIRRIKIRLAGIDAPELDQPWGQKSKWEMVKICKGKDIRVALTGETSYDRLVGTCYLPDGTDIGAEIIKAGLALDGGHFSKGKYKHLEPAGVRRKIRPFGNRRTPKPKKHS